MSEIRDLKQLNVELQNWVKKMQSEEKIGQSSFHCGKCGNPALFIEHDYLIKEIRIKCPICEEIIAEMEASITVLSEQYKQHKSSFDSLKEFHPKLNRDKKHPSEYCTYYKSGKCIAEQHNHHKCLWGHIDDCYKANEKQ